MAISMLRKPSVRQRTGYANSTLYARIEKGLFPPPVRIGKKMSGWPDTEVDAVIAATVAGYPPERLRDLVSRLVAERAMAAKAVGLE
ncbi:MAG: AlpA family phage regulatory protein [Pseudomonadota bacterium]